MFRAQFFLFPNTLRPSPSSCMSLPPYFFYSGLTLSFRYTVVFSSLTRRGKRASLVRVREGGKVLTTSCVYVCMCVRGSAAAWYGNAWTPPPWKQGSGRPSLGFAGGDRAVAGKTLFLGENSRFPGAASQRSREVQPRPAGGYHCDSPGFSKPQKCNIKNRISHTTIFPKWRWRPRRQHLELTAGGGGGDGKGVANACSHRKYYPLHKLTWVTNSSPPLLLHQSCIK